MREIVERDWAATLLWREIYDQIATWPETTRGCDSWIGGDEHHMVFCNRPAVAYAIFQGCFCYAHINYPLYAQPATLLYPMLHRRHYHVLFVSTSGVRSRGLRYEDAAAALDYISEQPDFGSGRSLTVVPCDQPCQQ
jgi:hypothetical protein